MYSTNLASESQDTTRLTVADILSTMASNGDMTPTTLSILDGLTGVPTRTTPTLTPTTLRNIEQTFLDLAANQVSHEHEAGFVPPSVPPSSIPHTSTTSASSTSVANYTATVTTASHTSSMNTNSEVKPWNGSHNSLGVSVMGVARATTRRVSVGSSSSSSNSSFGSASVTFTSNRKGGGRRKEDRDKEEVSGEEAEKRKIRRERNKLAAARCRKRRLDHTMSLQQETDMLEEKKQSMQSEIRQLQKQKEELEMLLESHRLQCKMRKTSHGSGKSANLLSVPNLNLLMKNRVTIKQERQDTDDSCSSEDVELDSFDSVNLSQSIHPKVEFTKPAPRPRPTSLPVASPFTQQIPRSSSNINEIAGIAITTPSSGIPGFNFESLMEGGTGLTPVVPSPSCSTQQRSSNLPVDLSSPEAVNRKLVSL